MSLCDFCLADFTVTLSSHQEAESAIERNAGLIQKKGTRPGEAAAV